MTSVLLLFVFVLGGTKSELGRCPNRFPLFFRGRPGESISVDPLSPRGPPNLGGSLSLSLLVRLCLGKAPFHRPKKHQKAHVSQRPPWRTECRPYGAVRPGVDVARLVGRCLRGHRAPERHRRPTVAPGRAGTRTPVPVGGGDTAETDHEVFSSVVLTCFEARPPLMNPWNP